MKNIKPFKAFREMDEYQKQKISNNPSLHKPKTDAIKKKISDTMKARWAATPNKPKITMNDLVLEKEKAIYLTEKEISNIIAECIMKALKMVNDNN